MITLVNGEIAGAANGALELTLNQDARVVVSPAIVVPKVPVVFQFDASGNLKAGAQIYSNLELSPQRAGELGTWYRAAIYAANGARLSGPQNWSFPVPANSVIDVGTMTAVEV